MDQMPPSKHFNMLRVNLLLARFRELLSRFWLSVCLVFRASFLCPGFPGFFLLLLGRQPENWPFTGLLHCQRLCESVSRRLCRTINTGIPCSHIMCQSSSIVRAASACLHHPVTALRLRNRPWSSPWMVVLDDLRCLVFRDTSADHSLFCFTSQFSSGCFRLVFLLPRTHGSSSTRSPQSSFQDVSSKFCVAELIHKCCSPIVSPYLYIHATLPDLVIRAVQRHLVRTFFA